MLGYIQDQKIWKKLSCFVLRVGESSQKPLHSTAVHFVQLTVMHEAIPYTLDL